jgi:hypothetical protein
VLHNLWPTARRSELVLKRALFLYALCMRMPFYLCKNILNLMLEMRGEHSTELPFACLITTLIVQSGIDISAQLVMRIQDPLGSQTFMRFNAQLLFEGHDEAPQPPSRQVEIPTGASS